MSKPAGHPCKVDSCGTVDKDKPMVFRGEDWCSDIHRKILKGESIGDHTDPTLTGAPPRPPREATTRKY